MKIKKVSVRDLSKDMREIRSFPARRTVHHPAGVPVRYTNEPKMLGTEYQYSATDTNVAWNLRTGIGTAFRHDEFEASAMPRLAAHGALPVILSHLTLGADTEMTAINKINCSWGVLADATREEILQTF